MNGLDVFPITPKPSNRAEHQWTYLRAISFLRNRLGIGALAPVNAGPIATFAMDE
jgi:hypothetical protein